MKFLWNASSHISFGGILTRGRTLWKKSFESLSLLKFLCFSCGPIKYPLFYTYITFLLESYIFFISLFFYPRDLKGPFVYTTCWVGSWYWSSSTVGCLSYHMPNCQSWMNPRNSACYAMLPRYKPNRVRPTQGGNADRLNRSQGRERDAF